MNEINFDDPRLTAFALGELEADEAAAIEALIAQDASLAAEVEEIRQTASMMQSGFASEAKPSLTTQQREAIEAPSAPQSLNSPLIFRMNARWIGAGLAAAACVALAVVVPMSMRSRDRDDNVAIGGKPVLENKLGQALDQQEQRDQTTLGTPLQAMSVLEADRARQLSQGPDIAAARTLATDDAGKMAEVLRIEGEKTIRSGADELAGITFGGSMPAPTGAPAGSGGVVAPGAPSGAREMRPEAAVASPPPPPPAPPPPMPAERKEKFAQNAPEPVSTSRRDVSDAKTDKDNEALKKEVSGELRAGQAAAADPQPITKEQAQQMSPSELGEAAGRVAKAYRNAGDDENRKLRLRGEFDVLQGQIRKAGEAAGPNHEGLALIEDNPFCKAMDPSTATSTFSIDVDTASYSNVRQYLNRGVLPPPDAVRIEEMVNYFRYSYEPPTGDAPFSANVEVTAAPWNPQNKLARIGLKGKEVRLDMRPATSLVFLVDVSGSMNQPAKLPLVKQSLKLLVDKLNGDDRLAIVTYAGNAGLVLESTYVNEQNKADVIGKIDALRAGGSTNGAGGINLAYDQATRHFIKDGVNRVILCTDGDFNVGVSSEGELTRLIEAQRTTGVFLSVLGFGTGNFKEDKMQQLAKNGNGNFAYIDTIDEGRKVLVEQMGGTLVTIAKDVKIQVHFNPAKVGSYRLIGYENRMLAAQDFRDDKKDAGEIGAGHTVTALYELTPADPNEERAVAPASDFMEAGKVVPSDLLLKVKMRFKAPDGDAATEIEFPVKDDAEPLDATSLDFKFAAAVAEFGMLLRDSIHKGAASFQNVLDLAGSVDADAGEAPAPDKQTLELMDSAIHYTLIAKPELALANMKALLESEASDQDLAATVKSGKRFDDAMKLAAKFPDLQEHAAKLRERVERGHQAPASIKVDDAERARRAEFVELVKQAATIAASQQEQ